MQMMAISMVQTAEGALIEIDNMLQRMRELGVQAASDTNRSTDRTALNAEFEALREEITRIAVNTQFNGAAVLAKQPIQQKLFRSVLMPVKQSASPLETSMLVPRLVQLV